MSIKLSPELSLELNSPERVEVLAVSNITQTEVEISWEKITNAERYIIFLKDSLGILQTFLTTDYNFLLTSLTSGQTYSLWIKAINSGSESENSTVIFFTTL